MERFPLLNSSSFFKSLSTSGGEPSSISGEKQLYQHYNVKLYIDCMVDTCKFLGAHCDKGCPSNVDGSYIYIDRQEK